jgi:hypothetical protein
LGEGAGRGGLGRATEQVIKLRASELIKLISGSDRCSDFLRDAQRNASDARRGRPARMIAGPVGSGGLLAGPGQLFFFPPRRRSSPPGFTSPRRSRGWKRGSWGDGAVGGPGREGG